MSRSSLKDFEILSRLGAGSFGTVFKVRRYADEQLYVIKNVRIAELSYKEQTEAINEVQILSQLKSPYVVRYYDSFIEDDSLHIVMEFCNRGDLQNLLKKAKEKNVAGLKESVVWSICLQVILGLHYLHKKHILHRDLKCANVFLTKDNSSPNYLVKIGDLGVAKLMDTSTALASTIVGTPYYLSPELCKDMPYRDKSDCWALGVIFYECCTLQRPFEAKNQCALILKIIEAPVEPPSSSTASPELINLVLWLLQKDPKNRPSTRQILNEAVVRSWLAESALELPDDLLDEEKSDYLRDTSRNFKDPFVIPSDPSPKVVRDGPSNMKTFVDDSKPVDPVAGSDKRVPLKGATPTRTCAKPSSNVEDRSRIRGDRVRGANKRVPSERALSRYQRNVETNKVDSKLSPTNMLSSETLRRSMKDLGEPYREDLEFSSHHSNSDDGKAGDGDLDAENGDNREDKMQDEDRSDQELDPYEDDFEECDVPRATTLLAQNHNQNTISQTGVVPLSAQSTVDFNTSNIGNGDEESELWNSVWTEKRGMVRGEAMHDDNDHGDDQAKGVIDVEPLEDLISEAKVRAVKALGESLFWKVYDLCSKHMDDDVQEDDRSKSDNAIFVQELESMLCDQSSAGIEVACEAVFGVKVLLALESKYNSLLARTATKKNKK